MTSRSARHTSGATTSPLLRYVRARRGPDAVAEMVRLSGVDRTVEDLQRVASWITYDETIALFEAAVVVLDDPHALVRVGEATIHHGVPALMLPLRLLGSPRNVYRQATRIASVFSTVAHVELVETTATSAVVRSALDPDLRPSRLSCDYIQGVLRAVPELFGLPPAEVDHATCASDGAPVCEFAVRWSSQSRVGRRVDDASRVELRALRGQLEALQLAAADTGGLQDLADAVPTIVERAAAAVVAPATLLVLDGLDEDSSVHAVGLSDDDAARLGALVRSGDPLDEPSLVVDVSGRRIHGRLALLFPGERRPTPEDRSLLETYARHVAAALDLLEALGASREEERRARSLLALAHALSAADDDPGAIAAALAEAIPRIVGCATSSVWLWDQSEGVLEAVATGGHDAASAEPFTRVALRPETTPELSQVLALHEAFVVHAAETGEPLSAFLHEVGSLTVVAAPMIAGSALMGLAVAGWGVRTDVDTQAPDALARLRAVTEQGGSALRNARLLATVRHQSLHDALTGLPNRVLFAQQLAEMLRATGQGGRTAVLFCDLDRFKAVNDRLGHAAGDELLRQAADRLREIVRPEDAAGRLSGDEFAVVLCDVDEAEAMSVATRLVARLGEPYRLEGHDIRVTASIGLAVHHGAHGRGDRLLAAADGAMYQAKRHGRAQVVAAGDAAAPRGILSMEAELAHALDEGQLRLWFQPVVDVARGNEGVVGAEALLRWEHPRLGLLPPAAFLPLAEEIGVMTALDLWAVDAACEAAASWPANGHGPRHVSVNLAAATLLDPDLVGRLRAALLAHGMEPAALHLEVIESRSLVDLPGVVDRLAELRQMGLRVALDDFGTGYSTLAWLQTLPVDEVKIDRSFTSRLGEDTASLAVVRGILALGAELGLEVVAEGVERPAQLALLRAAGCHLIQGFLLGRPAPTLDMTTPRPALVNLP